MFGSGIERFGSVLEKISAQGNKGDICVNICPGLFRSERPIESLLGEAHGL